MGQGIEIKDENKVDVEVLKVLKVESHGNLGIVINLVSIENVNIDTKLSLAFGELPQKEHYFEITEIMTGDANLLYLKATEVGFWAKKFDNKAGFDLRSLLGVDVSIITDETKIAQINKSSRMR